MWEHGNIVMSSTGYKKQALSQKISQKISQIIETTVFSVCVVGHS